MIIVSVVRRFRVRQALQERAKLMECPAMPAIGMVLDFNDGTGCAASALARNPAAPDHRLVDR